MKTYDIPLESLKPKNKFKMKLEDGELHVPAEEANLGKGRHHVIVPGKYKLPFCIDMKVKLKFLRTNQVTSQLRLYIGRGNVYFNGGHTSSTNIFTVSKSSIFGDNKSASFVSYSGLPSKEYVDISVIFGSKMMWATANDTHCYASDKLDYIEALRNNAIPDEFLDGIAIALSSGTDTKLTMKSLAVTEYEKDEPSIPKELTNLPELTPFEMFVKGLPPEVHDEMFKMDEFLLKDVKSSLKFRRTIDKNNHLTYASPCGLQYGTREFGVGKNHGTNWVQSPRKPDLTNEILKEIAVSSPELAKKIFAKVQHCDPHARECGRRTKVELMGDSKDVCASTIYYDMTVPDFEDVKKYIAVASEVVKSVKS